MATEKTLGKLVRDHQTIVIGAFVAAIILLAGLRNLLPAGLRYYLSALFAR